MTDHTPTTIGESLEQLLDRITFADPATHHLRDQWKATKRTEQEVFERVCREEFRNAIAASERAGRPPEERFRLLSGLFQHRWDAGQFESALEALRSGLGLAKEAGNAEHRCRFADQLGMCLQQLGNPQAAVPEHRFALRVARTLPGTELTENCLNNLGEALRKTGRSEEAIPLFREAEALRNEHAVSRQARAVHTTHPLSHTPP